MIELFAIAKGVFGFFGGSTFRMIWGEASSWITAKQDHKFELERMTLQGKLDSDQHERNLAAQRLQAELGVKVIHVQGEVDLAKLDAENFGKGVDNLGKPSGFKFIDGWKSAIQPALATVAMFMLMKHFQAIGWKLDDRGWELCGAVLGLFVADRLLFKRGK
jgi:hypothetical protein